MSDFIKVFESKNKKSFLKYKKYIQDNDWSVPQNNRTSAPFTKYVFVKDIRSSDKILIHEGKESEFTLQNNICKNTLGRLKYFHKQIESDIGKNIIVDRLIKNMLWILNLHTDRIERYLDNNSAIDANYDDIDNLDKDIRDIQSEDIEFENLLHKEHASITDTIRALNIEKKNDDSLVDIMNDEPVPLSMRSAIENTYPDVKNKMERMGLDFDKPPKNEMLIYMDPSEVPEWNVEKHYWEQDKKTLQFYIDEYKKMKNGIRVDDVYISGWLYTHINVFKTPVPTNIYNEVKKEYEVKDVVRNPPLRDNEWYIIQDEYREAEKDGKILFLCATRRAAKTTNIASHLFHKAQIGGKELVTAGGSSKDLGQIQKNFETASNNANPAFRLPFISTDWDNEVKIGMKRKNKRDILLSTLFIVNLVAGGKKASEKLAGFTADAFILDECMKSPFSDQLEAAKPAFESPYGKRCVPILSGTGSLNDALTEDAYKMLQNPDGHGIHKMNWDSLERNIPKQYITWKRREFATYLPAQMSAKEGMIKIEIPLSKYLGVEGENLDKIKIQVTDWENAIRIIKEDRSKLDGRPLKKEKVYFPIDPNEIFLSGNENPFPVEEIRRYKEALEETGDIGRPVTLSMDENSSDIIITPSSKEYPPLPYEGGFWDAPVTIYEDPITDPPLEFYVMGHDGYKQEESNSDSVGSFTVVRRDTGKVVASYHSRPDPTTKFYEQGYFLMKLYNATVFMENEDMGFKEYLDRRKETDLYLVKGADLLGDLQLNTNERRKYGWQPTAKNKSYFLGIFINMIKDHEEIENEDGTFTTIKGYTKIKDVRILGELINYTAGGNFDTVVSAMSAYVYDYYLTTLFGAPVLSKPKNTDGNIPMYKNIKRPLFPNKARKRLY